MLFPQVGSVITALLQSDSLSGCLNMSPSVFLPVQSLVKSHLDAIPEDRKAVDKGGGNAVQKLHEVEKYLRKNKLKVR